MKLVKAGPHQGCEIRIAWIKDSGFDSNVRFERFRNNEFESRLIAKIPDIDSPKSFQELANEAGSPEAAALQWYSENIDELE